MSIKVKIGGLVIGGGESVKIQSMTTYRPIDLQNTLAQIKRLEAAGCHIVRFCVKDMQDAAAIAQIKKQTTMPLVADIHFDYKLGIACLDAGVDKIRINPGNIGNQANLLELSRAIIANGAAVRVGSNSGSVEKQFLQKYGLGERALVESALSKVQMFENYGVKSIVISVKASDVALAVKAYRLVHTMTNYPLHIGITEAGTYENAVIKSAVGLGSLLLDGIGDTIRVSLTDAPEFEIGAAKKILRAAGKDTNFVDVISCPTCGRCEWDLMPLANKVQELTKNIKKPLKIAVMGCAVNGPGEARECDIGIAGGAHECIIFKYGEIYKKVAREDAWQEFIKEIKKIIDEL